MRRVSSVSRGVGAFKSGWRLCKQRTVTKRSSKKNGLDESAHLSHSLENCPKHALKLLQASPAKPGLYYASTVPASSWHARTPCRVKIKGLFRKRNHHGFSRRQATADHGRAVQPFDRLRYRQGLPSRGCGAGIQLSG